ncbi:hypothetical protein V865_001504 [Kwoniella europaea PYCC6329]|uniref:Uncharacterized protein n=1 Tax=Kwoniella europaea PYCC6329 TaxID=1423913 RepID=A0AAX4KAN9_9TREE
MVTLRDRKQPVAPRSPSDGRGTGVRSPLLSTKPPALSGDKSGWNASERYKGYFAPVEEESDTDAGNSSRPYRQASLETIAVRGRDVADDDTASLGLPGLEHWTKCIGMNDEKINNIKHFLRASKGWDAELKDTISALDFGRQPGYMADIMAKCRFTGCSHDDLESLNLSVDQLIKYAESDAHRSIVFNHATRGLSICKDHTSDELSNLPETRLKGFKMCGHTILLEHWDLEEDEQRAYTMRDLGSQNLICDVKIPIWEEKQTDGSWKELYLFRSIGPDTSASDPPTHLCSMISTLETDDQWVGRGQVPSSSDDGQK